MTVGAETCGAELVLVCVRFAGETVAFKVGVAKLPAGVGTVTGATLAFTCGVVTLTSGSPDVTGGLVGPTETLTGGTETLVSVGTDEVTLATICEKVSVIFGVVEATGWVRVFAVFAVDVACAAAGEEAGRLVLEAVAGVV